MQKQLRDGLILRSLSEGVATDSERLPKFYADTFGSEYGDPDDWRLGNWTADLISGHPTTTLEDIFVVVDPAQDDMIVSATLLIPQTWRYETVDIPTGRPELVATLPDYRNRGLVRALFEAVHERSEALGHNFQIITGIAHYYRQFGYSMAVDLGSHATIPFGIISNREEPRFTLRLAAAADIPNLISWSDYAARSRLLSCARSADEWRYELSGRQKDNVFHMFHFVIVDSKGGDVGFVSMRNWKNQEQTQCLAYAVGEQSSYLDTYEDVLFGIKSWAAEHFGELPALLAMGAWDHDGLDILMDRIWGASIRPREYAYYVRIPDLPRFIRDIAPVLERRLEGSAANRYTGELSIGFFDQKALVMTFDCGRIVDAVMAAKPQKDTNVSFPWNLFLNIVLGYHSHDEIRKVMPEANASAKAAVLLSALFPKKPSWVVPLA